MSRRPSFLARVIDRLIHSDALNTASRKNGSVRGRNASRSLTYDRHEERRLLAAASFNADLGQLVVHGTQAADDVVVSQTEDTVTVTHSQFSTSTFSGIQIGQIVFDGQAGDDSFDNQTSIPSVLNGGTGADRLFGGSGNDRLIGSSGYDLLIGRGGDDYLLGGIGNDLLNGGEGDDQLDGTRGLNELLGGAGNDVIHGGSDRDVISGGDGNDSLFGMGGDDQISGGSGVDRVFAGFGDDVVDGNSGNDIIHGQQGNDILLGGDGDDVLVGGNGDDRLSGQLGNDVVRGDQGTDTVIFDGNLEDHRANRSGSGWRVATSQNAAANGDLTRTVEQLGFADTTLTPQAAVALHQSTPTVTTPNETFGGTPTTSTPDTEPNDPEATDVDPDDQNNNAQTDGGVNETAGSGDAIGTESNFLPRFINEVVTIQPIIVSNDDGTNTAEFLGNGAQQAEILERIDGIYAVANVDIQFLQPRYVNNTFFNVGNNPLSLDRNPADVNEVIIQGDRLGVGHRDRLILDMYFVQVAPGDERVLGVVGAINGNGALIESGEDLSTAAGRENIATTIAHEVGHNLGLTHVVEGDNVETNLMFMDALPGVTQTLISNDFANDPDFIGDPNFFVGGGQIDVILASPYSQPIG